jgi:O-antigen/teichoic acid export membrane protein
VNVIKNNIISRLRSSQFVKNILIVMTGSAVAQAIGFALTPVISRLYNPADFGIFGSFSAVSGVIAAAVTLEYSRALMLPKKDDDAINVFVVSCLSTFIIAFMCLAICLIFSAFVNGLMKTDGIWALILLATATLIFGLNQSCQAWCVRVKAFKHTSASQVIRSVSSNSAQIGFGLLKSGSPGLIVSSILADLLAGINLMRVLIPDLLALRHAVRWERMKQLAAEYRDFPLYSASQGVINAVSAGLPVLLLNHFFGIAVAGAYAFGMRILHAPMSFVLTALRQVLFQKAAETQHQGRLLSPLYIKITAGLFGIALLPSMVLLIWAPPIFTWVFGSQWQTAGIFARSLVLWMLFVFCNVPAVLFARLIRIQRAVFFYDLLLLAARVTTLILGGLYLTASHTVMLFAVVGAVMNFILIVLVGYAVMKKESRLSWNHMRDSIR